jgi:hypothetical protein
MKQLNEGLDYLDFKNQIIPIVSIDEYAAKMGDDDEIVTIAFIVKGKQAGNDLVDWFERGYDWVLDSQVSEGELLKGKYVIFVETERRLKTPERLIEMLEDLETLTELKLTDWKVRIDEVDYPADAETISSNMITSPHEYRKIHEEDLNEMRELAGLDHHKVFTEQDEEIRAFKTIAGL